MIIKNEKQDRKREINERALRGRFTNLEKTLATNLADNRGLEEIVTNVKHHISNLPHIGQKLPKTWIKVRHALEEDTRNYISLQEYLEICEANRFTELKKQLQLSGYLHDLGVCLHFQDEEDSLLYKTVILKPEWGTYAVYKVLDNDQVINNKGHFTRNDLKNIWQDERYAFMRGELLELMKKFQLCYEVPESKDILIAPQLLSDNQPEYDWDENQNLILRYAYPDFMPKGIITHFIVIMHQYIEQQKYVWKSGVILNKDNTKAEVIENYGKREIKIRVEGSNKKNFLTIITHELDKINESYRRRLKYQKLIPCNCSDCKNKKEPYFHRFDVLQKAKEKGTLEVQCQQSFQMVDVLRLIDDVIIPYEKLENISKPNKTKNSTKTVKIFLASSSELKGDRKDFEIFINRKNKEYIKENLFLELVIWEDFIDAMSATRLQDEYNKAVEGCDIFVSLFHTKVGEYTEEEFSKALETFKANGKPLIYTYFKDAPINMSKITPDIMSLLNFKQKLNDLGHFYTVYADINDLKNKFSDQLIKVLPQLST